MDTWLDRLFILLVFVGFAIFIALHQMSIHDLTMAVSKNSADIKIHETIMEAQDQMIKDAFGIEWEKTKEERLKALY